MRAGGSASWRVVAEGQQAGRAGVVGLEKDELRADDASARVGGLADRYGVMESKVGVPVRLQELAYARGTLGRGEGGRGE
jgi:hypothetical protein